MVEQHKPRRVTVLSRDELKQSEMKVRWPNDEVRFLLGDVRDYDRLRRAFQGVDIVVHAAALKHVPAVEADPFEAVQTNIMGGKNVIEAAIDTGVTRVLALSTDKAVAPANLYGATKLVAEKLFVQGNAYSGDSGTRLSCVRYGNVIGSRGSVIPVFMEQRETGKISITDERMTRFWISLQMGVKFVIESLERMRGGEIYVPKIPSMRIMELAEVVAPGCEIELVGIRSGEKLHEAMISADEASRTLEYETFFMILPANSVWHEGGSAGGTPVPEGFEYTSDANPSAMSGTELANLIEGL